MSVTRRNAGLQHGGQLLGEQDQLFWMDGAEQLRELLPAPAGRGGGFVVQRERGQAAGAQQIVRMVEGIGVDPAPDGLAGLVQRLVAVMVHGGTCFRC